MSKAAVWSTTSHVVGVGGRFYATVRHEEISIDVTPDQIFFGKIFGMGASIVAKMLKSDWLKNINFLIGFFIGIKIDYP